MLPLIDKSPQLPHRSTSKTSDLKLNCLCLTLRKPFQSKTTRFSCARWKKLMTLSPTLLHHLETTQDPTTTDPPYRIREWQCPTWPAALTSSSSPSAKPSHPSSQAHGSSSKRYTASLTSLRMHSSSAPVMLLLCTLTYQQSSPLCAITLVPIDQASFPTVKLCNDCFDGISDCLILHSK
jgi:hypothetical protein